MRNLTYSLQLFTLDNLVIIPGSWLDIPLEKKAIAIVPLD